MLNLLDSIWVTQTAFAEEYVIEYLGEHILLFREFFQHFLFQKIKKLNLSPCYIFFTARRRSRGEENTGISYKYFYLCTIHQYR